LLIVYLLDTKNDKKSMPSPMSQID